MTENRDSKSRCNPYLSKAPPEGIDVEFDRRFKERLCEFAISTSNEEGDGGDLGLYPKLESYSNRESLISQLCSSSHLEKQFLQNLHEQKKNEVYIEKQNLPLQHELLQIDQVRLGQTQNEQKEQLMAMEYGESLRLQIEENSKRRIHENQTFMNFPYSKSKPHINHEENNKENILQYVQQDPSADMKMNAHGVSDIWCITDQNAQQQIAKEIHMDDSRNIRKLEGDHNTFLPHLESKTQTANPRNTDKEEKRKKQLLYAKQLAEQIAQKKGLSKLKK